MCRRLPPSHCCQTALSHAALVLVLGLVLVPFGPSSAIDALVDTAMGAQIVVKRAITDAGVGATEAEAGTGEVEATVVAAADVSTLVECTEMPRSWC